jgi:omega-6 fatty acid desaturase (delta-12 desaturase)
LTGSLQNWASRLAVYRVPDNGRAVFEVAVTALPFVACWIGMFLLLKISYWLTLIAAIPTAGFLVRLFMIQHDCGHGALFSARNVNDWVGRTIGVLTLTPYDYWRRSHALHHAGSGNLDRRGFGDIDTLTVKEYLALCGRQRLRYRLYRHPLVMFGLGPAYLFLIQHRLPLGAMLKGRLPWFGTMMTNVAIAVVSLGMVLLVGLEAFLLIHLPLVLLAASAGVWLFYVQHQFEETHWSRGQEWQHEEAALHGSSYYDLPPILMWFTGNIGIHHLHHLASRIPFHRLPKVMKDHPELSKIGRLTIRDSLATVRLTLWDEQKRRLISFRDLRNQLRFERPQAA